MKSNARIKTLLALLPLFLFGCTNNPAPSTSGESSNQSETSTSTSEESTITSQSEESTTESSEETSETSTEESTFSSESVESSSEETSVSSEASEPEESSSEESSVESSEESSSEEPPQKDGVYHFYCVNDFHGAVVEQYNGSYYENGIVKYFGELMKLKEADPEHTILLSAGDMFQGSLESNYNFGMLVTDAMNTAGFEAMCVGNHEFDYGPERLLDIIEEAEFPVLGGNIMLYDNGPTNTPWNESIGISTVVQKAGAKIGIVGMIGEGQTTSIASQYVQDVTFVDPENLAKSEATRLRNEEDCDIVILLVHDSYANTSWAANRMYFDGVFNGHTHRNEQYFKNNVPLIQSICNGEAYSYFDITIQNGSNSCTSYGVQYASENFVESEDVQKIYDEYLNSSFLEMAEAPAGFVAGTLKAKEGVPHLCAKAMYEYYKGSYSDVALAMINGQRASLSGNITYHDIVKATPFMNNIIIARVAGVDIISEAAYNPTYTEDLEKYSYIDPLEFYTIIVTDYVVCHQGVDKIYDYFPSLNEGQGGEILGAYETYPYDLVFDYVKNDLGGYLHYSDYQTGTNGFSIYA